MKKKTFVGCLVLCLLTLIAYSGYIFWEDRQAALLELRNLCDWVMHQDKEYRLIETGILSSSGYKSVEGDSTTVLFSGNHVEKVAKKTNAVDLVAEEKQYRVDQSFLLMENPIDIFVLDSLFNLALQKNKMISIKAALAYTVNNGTTKFSNPDLTFYKSACALSPIVTGVKEEIVIQAYVDIPFTYVIGSNKESFILLLIVFCLIMGVVFVILSTNRQLIPMQEKPRKLIKIKENLLFDKERGILYFNNNTPVSLVKINLKLFILLLESPEHFQTTEDIKTIVWGKTGLTQATLNTTIKRLRDGLKPIPDLKIVFDKEGYRLEIH